MECSPATRFCSITVLLGSALLLPTARGTQAPSDIGKVMAMEQHSNKEIALGVQAVELTEEGEVTNKMEPGVKVFSTGTWAQWSPHQVQEGPEEDRDHLYHPQDDGMEAGVHGPHWMLSLEVQSSPEEDRDHVYHS
ncbi:proline-rich acidic protein 1 [Heliangelus exortis]|uniref:proline-rich acidic protein 1 n=1 Tax=Heliangelus exortis TaxID=472823 RepID=UPI003A953F28